MIKFHDIPFDIIDPSNLQKLEDFDLLELEAEFLDKKFSFIIPNTVVGNKDRRIYHAGFLNEVYSSLKPTLLKKDIFVFITVEYNIFVDERQYQNLIREYNEKKYTTFIKK